MKIQPVIILKLRSFLKKEMKMFPLEHVIVLDVQKKIVLELELIKQILVLVLK